MIEIEASELHRSVGEVMFINSWFFGVHLLVLLANFTIWALFMISSYMKGQWYLCAAAFLDFVTPK